MKTDTTIPELSPIEVEPVDTAKNEILSSLDNAIPYILNIEFFEGTANLDQKSNDEIGELVDFLKAYSRSCMLWKKYADVQKTRKNRVQSNGRFRNF